MLNCSDWSECQCTCSQSGFQGDWSEPDLVWVFPGKIQSASSWCARLKAAGHCWTHRGACSMCVHTRICALIVSLIFRVETLLTRTLSHQSKTRLIFFQTFICFMMLSCISRTRVRARADTHTRTHTLSACIFLCLMSLLWYTDSSFLQGGKTHRIQRALTQPSVLRECWEVKTQRQIRVQVSVNAAAFNMIWRYEGKYTYMPLCVTTKNTTNCSSSNVHLRLVKKLISSQQ